MLCVGSDYIMIDCTPCGAIFVIYPVYKWHHKERYFYIFSGSCHSYSILGCVRPAHRHGRAALILALPGSGGPAIEY